MAELIAHLLDDIRAESGRLLVSDVGAYDEGDTLPWDQEWPSVEVNDDFAAGDNGFVLETDRWATAARAGGRCGSPACCWRTTGGRSSRATRCGGTCSGCGSGVRRIGRVIYLARGGRVGLRYLTMADAAEILALNAESRDLHRPWLPGEPVTTPEAFEAYLGRFDGSAHEGFVICRLDTGRIAGRVNINNIVRGTHQAGMISYAAYASTAGRGYMTEGLRLLVPFAFGELELHRLEANIQPGNTASLRLVERVGFRREGYSPHFQFIDGAWRDHERWAITAEMV
ncbi:GNAT family N-acetyltransferase [Nonomuraea sp. NPDC050783]|uniref:GNAT family N-acetyltransferase n=1 Tax=Nonomuraea sp. NPDC050783 TaxID=3154634 RepID=UPI0034676E7A